MSSSWTFIKPAATNLSILNFPILLPNHLLLIPLLEFCCQSLNFEMIPSSLGVTLGVGIFTTLFSVYFIARLLTSLYVIKNKNEQRLI